MPLRQIKTVEDLKRMPEWKHLRDHVKYWLKQVYSTDFPNQSDGISWISQLTFSKHPAGVMHDYCYATACLNRKESDVLFKEALTDFGYPQYAVWYYRALRAFGWIAWAKARFNDDR